MEAAIKAAQFFLSLSILVILHEMGHFLFAKLFKTRVEKFYLFFDPWFSIFKFKKGETEYGVGWLPLGGYVKISGMIDESMDKEQMKQPPQPWEFRSKSTWQRLLIMVGGVLVNFLLALVIYSIVLFKWGEDYLPNRNVKYGIACDQIAIEAGLRSGDKIISLDNKPIDNFLRVVPEIVLYGHNTLVVERDGKLVNIAISDSLISKLISTKGFILPRIPFYIDTFTDASIALNAGMQKDDKIIAVNDVNTEFFDEFRNEISKYKRKEVTIKVLRNSDTLSYKVTLDSTGLLGVGARETYKLLDFVHIDYTFSQALPAGIMKGFNGIRDYLAQFKLLFRPKTKAYESLGGFITIGKIFPGVWDWQAFWNLTAFLSLILAIMNILPIPALDGGHVMFLLYEIVTGRKPGDKFLEYAQIVGMVLLFSLLIYVNANDIIKLFK
jgi:regulator of sigma E protease